MFGGAAELAGSTAQAIVEMAQKMAGLFLVALILFIRVRGLCRGVGIPVWTAAGHNRQSSPGVQPLRNFQMSLPNSSASEPSPTWATSTVGMSIAILDRMERAVLKVRERLLRAAAALEAAQIPYAVVGGNAVASWVATVDEGAVRNTRDVDLLVRRGDLPAITAALERVGFVGGTQLDVVMFRDGEEGKPSEAVHLLFVGEKARPDHLLPAPELTTVQNADNLRVITLQSLVILKLISNRRKDQVHVEDLINVGLIDAGWLAKLPPELASRLKAILDTPDG